MLKSKMRSRRVQNLSIRSTSTSRKLRSSKRPEIMRRSPIRAPLPTIVKGKRQKRSSNRHKKSKGTSRRIKLIDAQDQTHSPRTKLILKVLDKDSPSKSGIRTFLKSPVISSLKMARMGSRPKNHSEAREGVDFFCNLGQRVLQSRTVDMQKGLRDGEGGLTKGIVGGRPMAVRFEAGILDAGRLEAGGHSTGGPMRLAMGLGTLCPGAVLNSSASLAVKDVVVPLTNRLPIIDFISTNEFNKMNETQKGVRRHNR